MSKVLGQVRGFINLGCDMDLICFDRNSRVTLTSSLKEDNRLLTPRVLYRSNKNLLIRRFNLLKAATEHILQSKPEFLYVRYPRSDPLYLSFLANIRNRVPALIILSEFPTYPYDKEYEATSCRKDRLVFFLDKATRSCLKYFINQAISINYGASIFGMNTISITNGINISDYEPVGRKPASLNTINIIGVANVNSWHGYDRVISGLGEYYRNSSGSDRKITFHIVGARFPYLKELLTLASKEGVTHAVVFHEPQQGRFLDLIFMNCHLAIGVLGGHRKDLYVMSPLKNREYCARGIPFVFSHTDPDFSSDFEYCLQLKSDESPLNIEELISFATDVYSKSDCVVEMRNYSRRFLDWSVKLQPVYTYLIEKNDS